MDERKELNAALPADVPAAEPCADAAPQGAKKPYVKPTMQVFPLNCQMLAASGPVQVAVSGGFSMYGYCYDQLCYERRGDITVDDLFTSPSFSRLTNSGYWFQIDGPMAYSDMCYFSDEHLSTAYRSYAGRLRKAWGPLVRFGAGGEGWNEADFLANVVLEGDGVFISGPLPDIEVTKTVTGEYNGVPVLVTMGLEVTGYNGC
ncbi:MAG: hypothetical protein IJ722_04205 [Alloprevotella sp.]|nr:hypothetical protein [Alloprevotella sp.]